MRKIFRWFMSRFKRKPSYGILTPRTSLITQATGEKLKRGQWMYREVIPTGTPWWRTYPQDEEKSGQVGSDEVC